MPPSPCRSLAHIFSLHLRAEGVKLWECSVRTTLKFRPFPSCHYSEVVRKEAACEYLHSFRKFWIIQMIYHESHPHVYHSCPDNSCADRGCALLAPRNRCVHQLKMAVCVQSTPQTGYQIGSSSRSQKLFFFTLSYFAQLPWLRTSPIGGYRHWWTS